MEPYQEQKTSTVNLPQALYKKVNPLTSLASFPCNISIQGQNNNERILLFIREHRITLLFDLLFYSIALFVPFMIQYFFNLFNKLILNNTINVGEFFGSKYWRVFILLWLSYMLRGYFNLFFKWFYNINVLTTNRLMDIDFLGIFFVRAEETSITDIEDVKDTQAGIIQSIFNMGNIEVFTASGVTVFNLNNVPKSYKVRDFIMDVVVEERRKRKREND